MQNERTNPSDEYAVDALAFLRAFVCEPPCTVKLTPTATHLVHDRDVATHRNNQPREQEQESSHATFTPTKIVNGRELAVDWRLTTQPNSDELVETQVKSRSPQVLTPLHSEAL